jgi:hypothetical protein
VGSSCQPLDDVRVRVAEFSAEQTDDRVAHRREYLGGIPGADPAAILAERHVPYGVELILDAPVLADQLQQARRVGPVFRPAGDAVDDLRRRLAIAGDGAGPAEALRETLPELEAGPDRSGLERANCDPAARLLDGPGEEWGKRRDLRGRDAAGRGKKSERFRRNSGRRRCRSPSRAGCPSP